MIKYIKLFFNSNKPKENKNTPLDTIALQNSNNVVYISNQQLISKNKISYYNCQQNIDDIQVIYFTCINNKGLLFVAGKHNSHIPITSNNFEQTFEQLANQLGFSKNLLPLFTSTTFCERNMFVWARQNKTNFTVLTDKNSNDLFIGYEIQNSNKTFISWDTTYAEVINLPEVDTCLPDNKDDLVKFTFNTPVRVGDVVLNDFSFYNCPRRNIAVSTYFSYCESSENGEKPYVLLKRLLLNYKTLSSIIKNKIEENEYISSTTVQTPELEFYLSNAYPSTLDAANNKVFFLVSNLKEYPESVVYPDHILKLAISHCTTLDNSIYLDIESYKENPNIYRTPTFIQEISHNKAFIWIDENNKEVGFSDDLYIHLFPQKDIEYLCIQTTIDEEGKIKSHLSVKISSNDTVVPVFNSETDSLKHFENQIKEDIPIPFKSPLDEFIF